MNKRVFFNFLRHLLFLFMILKFFASLGFVFQLEICRNCFDEKPILPLETGTEAYLATNIGIDFFFDCFQGLGLVGTVISVVGFWGGIYINSHSVVNFAVGRALVFLCPIEFTSWWVLNRLKGTFYRMIHESLQRIFGPMTECPLIDRNLPDVFVDEEIIFNTDGWSIIFNGNKTYRDYIDFYQITLNCCGLFGRFSFDSPLPRSCCSTKHYRNCSFMTAWPKSCMTDYYQLESCLQTLGVGTIFYGLMSIATGFVGLYLSKLKMRYPDGNFSDEDESSTPEEEDVVFEEDAES